jgi:hypothetical protein
MSDMMNTLRARKKEREARNDQLRTILREFEARLRDAAGEKDVHGRSEQCVLEEYGDGDGYYGFLTFDGKLQVAYRSTEDDFNDLHNDDLHPGAEPTFTVIDLERCHPVWMRELADQKIMDSLGTNLSSHLESDIAATVKGVKSVEEAANLPLRELEVEIAEVSAKLGYPKVQEQWQKAQEALAIDPAQALTRAYQLIETVSKHILHTKSIETTGNPDLPVLFKAAARCLGLSSDPTALQALKTINKGLSSVVFGVAALRNQASISHGTAPASQPVTLSQARLAVNAAGVLATYLLDALIADLGSTAAQ